MQSTHKVTIDINKIADQWARIEDVAKSENWKYSYDIDTDNLYFSPKKLVGDLHPFTLKNDYTLLLDPESNVKGLFIEYFKNNLTSHDSRFKNMKNLFTKKGQNKTEKIHFMEIVAKDILSELQLNYKNKPNIEAYIPGPMYAV
jgi:hypothetical protein